MWRKCFLLKFRISLRGGAIKTLKSEGYKTYLQFYTVFQGLLAIEAGAD